MSDQDLIGYDDIIENSMRLVICETLKKIEKTGLLGEHYFIITFATKMSGVDVPESLKEKYPEEMTIVIQNQYKSLKVGQENFTISLSFNGKYEKLTVPYKAITSFSDPSMNFSLRFSVVFNKNDEDDYEIVSNGSKKSANQDKLENKVDLSAKVVSLDAFRKNKNNK